jgi:hypothetical protein
MAEFVKSPGFSSGSQQTRASYDGKDPQKRLIPFGTEFRMNGMKQLFPCNSVLREKGKEQRGAFSLEEREQKNWKLRRTTDLCKLNKVIQTLWDSA